MKWNAARLALCLTFAAAGCGDRRIPVGWWPAGGAAGMNPGMGGSTGMMGQGGASVPSDGGMPVPICAMPAAMPLRSVTPGSQLADRLSAFLWDAQPDGPLLMQSQGVHTTTELATLAQGMLDDSRSGSGLKTLIQAWLQPERALMVPVRGTIDAATLAVLRPSMYDETRRFVSDVLTSHGTLNRLLTSSDSFIDAPLASLYGAMHPGGGFTKVALDPVQRSGVLTHASTLFAQPFATARGKWIRDAFFCQQIPPPPANLGDPVVQLPGQTSRQALSQGVAANPACQGCHTLTDPLGFALEHYDPIGRYRTTDNGAPVDSSVVLSDMNGAQVKDARDLGNLLAVSCEVQTCVARKFLGQALRRDLTDRDEPSVIEMTRAFAASGLDLQALLLATVQSPAFISP